MESFGKVTSGTQGSDSNKQWAVLAPRILLLYRQKRKRNQCLKHYNVYVNVYIFIRYGPKIRCAKTAQ